MIHLLLAHLHNLNDFLKMIIKKLYNISNVIKNEGIKGSLIRVKNILLMLLGLRISETLCYRMSLENNKINKEAKIDKISKNIKCKIFKNLKELYNINDYQKKIDFLPAEEWINKGAVCISLFYNAKMVGYMWVQSNRYDIKNMGTFVIKKNEIYLGPAFINKKFRKKGLYHVLMENSLKYSKDIGTTYVYSTSSIKNIPSIKTFVSHGFEVVGCVRYKNKNRREVLEFNNEKIITERITEI